MIAVELKCIRIHAFHQHFLIGTIRKNTCILKRARAGKLNIVHQRIHIHRLRFVNKITDKLRILQQCNLDFIRLFGAPALPRQHGHSAVDAVRVVVERFAEDCRKLRRAHFLSCF